MRYAWKEMSKEASSSQRRGKLSFEEISACVRECNEQAQIMGDPWEIMVDRGRVGGGGRAGGGEG